MTAEFRTDATWVAGLLALCGPSLGGALVAEDSTDSFAATYERAADVEAQLRGVPSSMSAEALTGTIDLAATLAAGTPVLTKGLLAASPQLLVRRAERLDPACAALLAGALDRQAVLLVASLDLLDTEATLAAQLEPRLPFAVRDIAQPVWDRTQIRRSRTYLQALGVEESWIRQLCEAALAVGVPSPRSVVQAVHVARAIAALQGLAKVDEGSVALAARLVLAHRARHVPAPDQEIDLREPPAAEPQDRPDDGANQKGRPADAEVILEAIKTALPSNLLQSAGSSAARRTAGRNVRSNAPNKSHGQRGRRIGSRRATSLVRQRLDILATLHKAAPWQPLRRRWSKAGRMLVTRDDFQVSRIKQRNEATAIFAIDASGSTAFQRLAEAKGAVETILADCYVRRDKVALVAFRSKRAELLLPPTRSLERAKRALSGLPGGGGTPLAAGLDEAFSIAVQVRRSGGNPIVVLLTDGRGNVTREGEGNKAKALEESQAAARLFAVEAIDAMLIDVSPEPQKAARALAHAMQAKYLPMPRANATDIARPVTSALRAASG